MPTIASLCTFRFARAAGASFALASLLAAFTPACSSSSSSSAVDGAPTCSAKQVIIAGTIDGKNQAGTFPFGGGGIDQLGSPFAEFTFGGKGTTRLEWSQAAMDGEKTPLTGRTFTSAVDGTTYCIGAGSEIKLGGGGGQFALSGLKLGACPGTTAVSGSVQGCFDIGN
jgi:hypothetical protein